MAAQKLSEGSKPGKIRLSLLGGFGLLLAGEPTPIARASQRLLALLALHHQRPVPRSYVAGVLWPESTESAARSDLRSALSRLGPLRKILVEATPEALRLQPAARIDYEGRRSLARRVLDPSGDGVHVPPDLFEDDLLPEWSDVWIEPERESYRQLRLHALETISARLVKAGRFGAALEAGLKALSAAPLRESAHRAVIHALIAEGNRVEAVSYYQRLCDLLYQELGVEPSFRLDDLRMAASQ